MGLRIRRSVKLGKGVKLNLSKSGMSLSVGGKGNTVNFSGKGVRHTVSLPGTGISYTNNLSSGSRSRQGLSSSQEVVLTNSYINKPIYLLPDKTPGTSIILIGLGITVVGLFLPPLLLAAIGCLFFGLYKSLFSKEGRAFNKLRSAMDDYGKGKFDKCRDKLIKVKEVLGDTNDKANALDGLLLSMNDEQEKALMYLENLPDNFKSNITIKQATAIAYYATKNYDKSISIMQNVYRDNPDNFQILLLIGMCFYEKGDYESAIAALTKAPLTKRTIDDQLIHIRYYLGLSYLKLGDKRKAKTQLLKVYSHDVCYENISELMDEINGKTAEK